MMDETKALVTDQKKVRCLEPTKDPKLVEMTESLKAPKMAAKMVYLTGCHLVRLLELPKALMMELPTVSMMDKKKA